MHGSAAHIAKNAETYALTVTINYEIQRKQDGGFEPEEYVKWADSLFAGVLRQPYRPTITKCTPNTAGVAVFLAFPLFGPTI